MIRKLLLPVLITASASIAVEPKIEYSGDVTLGTYMDFSKGVKPRYKGNHEVNLGTRYKFDENVYLNFVIESYSVTIDSAGNQTRTNPIRGNGSPDLGSVNSSALDVREANVGWEFTETGYFLLGQFNFSGGQLLWERFSNNKFHSSIIKEQSIRGLGLNLSGLEVYFGNTLEGEKSTAIFAAFKYDFIEKSTENFSLRPMLDWQILGPGRERKWSLGIEYNYSSIYKGMNYSLDGSAGWVPYRKNASYTFMFEPSVSKNDFSLASRLFYVFEADKDKGLEEQIDLPYKYILSLEPSIQISNKVALGIEYSYLDPSFEMGEDQHSIISPKIYVYPNHVYDFNIWSDLVFEEDKLDHKAGIDLRVKF